MTSNKTSASLFDSLKKAIANRRTVKPEQFNGKRIPDPEIEELLQLANWAPTHGYTEPWRFVVFTGEALRSISTFHADLYKREMEGAGKLPVKYEKIISRTENTSHLIAIGMKRGSNDKIPASEEHIAAGIAAHHIWLGASARGIACYWGSGGMTYHPEMRKYLGWDGREDQVLGFLYLGYTDDDIKPGRRLTGIEEKVEWRRD